MAEKSFIIDLVRQAEQLIPEDINDADKKFILGTINRFLNSANDSLYEENFSDEDEYLILQFLGEWIFHKGIDFVRAGLKKETIDELLRHICFNIYDITKILIQKSYKQNEIVVCVESHVLKATKEKLEELLKNNVITEEDYKNALSQSNIDTMFEECEENDEKEKTADEIIEDIEKSRDFENKEIKFTQNYSWYQIFITVVFVLFLILKFVHYCIKYVF